MNDQDDSGKKMSIRKQSPRKQPIAENYLRARYDSGGFTTTKTLTESVGRLLELGTAISVCRHLNVAGAEERVGRLASSYFNTALAAELELLTAFRVATHLPGAEVEILKETSEKTPDILEHSNGIAFECKQVVRVQGEDAKNSDAWGILQRRSGKVFDEMGLSGASLEMITDTSPSLADIEMVMKSLAEFRQSGGGDVSHGNPSAGTYIRLASFMTERGSDGIYFPEKQAGLQRPLPEYDGGALEFTMRARRTKKDVQTADHRALVWAFTTRKSLDVASWIHDRAKRARSQTSGYKHRVLVSRVEWPPFTRNKSLEQKAHLLLTGARRTLDRESWLDAIVLVTEQARDEGTQDWRNWLIVTRNGAFPGEWDMAANGIAAPSTPEYLDDALTRAGVDLVGGRKQDCWCGSGRRLKNCHSI